jgi:hypothetical protein
MAEEKKVVPISDAVLRAYDVSPNVHGKMDFGTMFGNTQIDMSTATVEQIESFCEEFKEQKFFKKKSTVVGAQRTSVPAEKG